MNIGIVTVWGERGASVVSKSYITALENNHNIFIYSRGGEQDIRYQKTEMNVWRGKDSYIPITNHIIKTDFLNWLKTHNIELVLFNEQHWFEPLLWLKKLNIKSVSYVDYYTEETVPLYGLYDALICNTKRHYKAFNDHHNVIYIPWGLNTEEYTLADNTSDKNNAVFFHSCGMNPLRKGTDLLLKAAVKLTGNFKLIIHTQRNLFDFYKDDESIIDCLTMLEKSESLTLITKTVSAPGLYHLGNVYVYPCRLDGLGLTVSEAISSGLPTIVPDAEPMKEFISTACSLVAIDRFYCRKDAYYWPQQLCDIDDLSKKMQQYVEEENLEGKMNIARKHAIEKLNWQHNSAELHKFIQKTNVTPLTQAMAATYNKFKYYGYRKILTKIEKHQNFFSPLLHLYSKLKK
ncbi:MAG: glycosyltransferase family 4 protein [Colwellia sp.]|nr:glycosyltransferase family 4 protein [Colwellia sp.]